MAQCLSSHLLHTEHLKQLVLAKFRQQAETNILPVDDNVVVIYNRVPKTGSTSFVNLTYELCKRSQNNFHVLHLNITGNMHTMSLPNQMKFVRNVTHWNAMKPAFFHGHMAFLDFAK
jgi:heparan sulfate 2-O-sulfotransferase HS2ST1